MSIKNVILPFLLAVSFIALGQRKPYPIKIEKKEVIVGKTALGADIKGVSINFPEPVHDYHFDSARNELITIIRKDGHKSRGAMGALDLTTLQLNWTKEIQGDRFNYDYDDDKLVLRKPGEIAVYERNGGKRRWTKQGDFAWVDLKHNIGLSPYGMATNLDNGAVKWRTKINPSYGWQDVEYLDDQNIVIAAGGLKKINLTNGSGWQYDARIGADDYKRVAGMAAAGLATAVLLGVAVVPTGPDHIWGLCSNIEVDSGCIYFASRDDIMCLDKEGKLRWKTALPEKQTGNSTIWIKNGRVYMVNSAYGVMNGTRWNKGNPYIASFDKKTGKTVYLTELGTKNMLFSTNLLGDTLYVHSGDMLHKYDMADGHKLLEINARERQLNKARPFISDDLYFVQTTDGDFKRLRELYRGEKFLISDQGVIRINANLQSVGTIKEDLWTLFEENGVTTVFASRKKMAFVTSGKTEAVIDLHNYSLHGNTIIDVDKYDLRVIDVSNLLSPTSKL